MYCNCRLVEEAIERDVLQKKKRSFVVTLSDGRTIRAYDYGTKYEILKKFKNKLIARTTVAHVEFI